MGRASVKRKTAEQCYMKDVQKTLWDRLSRLLSHRSLTSVRNAVETDEDECSDINKFGNLEPLSRTVTPFRIKIMLIVVNWAVDLRIV